MLPSSARTERKTLPTLPLLASFTCAVVDAARCFARAERWCDGAHKGTSRPDYFLSVCAHCPPRRRRERSLPYAIARRLQQEHGDSYPLPLFLHYPDDAQLRVVSDDFVRSCLSPMAYRLWRRLLARTTPPHCLFDLGELYAVEQEPLLLAARRELERAGLVVRCEDFCSTYVVGLWRDEWRQQETHDQGAIPLTRAAVIALRRERARAEKRKNSDGSASTAGTPARTKGATRP